MTYNLVQGGRTLVEGITDYGEAIALRDALEATGGRVSQAIDIEEDLGGLEQEAGR